MLSKGNVTVFGLEVPVYERITVEERESLELLSVQTYTEKLSDSRSTYEALRIIIKSRTGAELPAWLSKLFDDNYRDYFDDYSQIEDAAYQLLEPFRAEQDVKKARRQAQALEAAGNAKALRALIQASELVMSQFRSALDRLEKTGNGPN